MMTRRILISRTRQTNGSKNKGKSARRRSIDAEDRKKNFEEATDKRAIEKEVEGLIRQMNLLAQDDPSYG